MKIAIVGALKIEVTLLADHLENKNTHRFFDAEVFEGTLGEHTIMLTELGVGKVNAALITQRMIDLYAPDLIINTGIAGSLDDNVGILDTVFSKELVYHDFDPEILASFAPYCTRFVSDAKTLELAESAAKTLGFSYHVGTITTGDEFVTNTARKDDIKERTDALCVEMEGCAVAHTAYRNEVPFLVVRSISDGANDGAELTYDEFSKEAAIRSAQLLIEMFQ